MFNKSDTYYVFGNKGIAVEIAELLTKSNKNVLGYVLDEQYLIEDESLTHNIPIIPYNKLIEKANTESIHIVVSLGEPKYRRLISQRLIKDNLYETGVNFSSFVSDSSVVGDGAILHFGSFISNNTIIGNSCLINKMCVIGHNSIIGDYSVISPSVTVGGNVNIGSNTFIGLGACIRDRIKIGNNCIIGMGAVVTKDVADNSVVVGNPARYIYDNKNELVFNHNQ